MWRSALLLHESVNNKLMTRHFYDLSAISLQGKEISMAGYRGKVVLVVNTASKCGFTPQLEGLEKLYEKYKDRGLVVLGFPCNQFAHQEPGDEKSIEGGCVLNYGVTFQMFSKIDVNGPGAHPIYRWLKSQKKGRGLFGNRIKWNFTKFLVDSNGEVVGRFGSAKRPEQLDALIIKMLQP